jgi:hypothetical protein
MRNSIPIDKVWGLNNVRQCIAFRETQKDKKDKCNFLEPKKGYQKDEKKIFKSNKND